MSALVFFVHGTPAPQGSKRHVGRGVMVESSKRVAPWRIDVKHAALAAIDATGDDWTPIAGPASANVTFFHTRPRGHYGTGRNADTLKPSAPTWVTSRAAGDLDKLLRSTFDALVAAGVIADDSLITTVRASQVYSDDGIAGAQIAIGELHNPGADA